ncbi:recombinase, partial [Salmonella enterica subsp. enterica serovar 4,[5],12:i:-]|nr:recombinase [Salmonella enterica subsp. enterica serovar 4,[5],12:i:-]
MSTTKTLPLLNSLTSLAAIRPPFFCHMKTIEQKIEQHRKWQKAARE